MFYSVRPYRNGPMLLKHMLKQIVLNHSENSTVSPKSSESHKSSFIMIRSISMLVFYRLAMMFEVLLCINVHTFAIL